MQVMLKVLIAIPVRLCSGCDDEVIIGVFFAIGIDILAGDIVDCSVNENKIRLIIPKVFKKVRVASQ